MGFLPVLDRCQEPATCSELLCEQGPVYQMLNQHFRQPASVQLEQAAFICGDLGLILKYSDDAENALQKYCDIRRNGDYQRLPQHCQEFRYNLQRWLPNDIQRSQFAYAVYRKMYQKAGELMKTGTIEAAESYFGAAWELCGEDLLRHLFCFCSIDFAL